MKSILKINCKRVYKSAMDFDELNQKYCLLLEKMQNISSGISESYSGIDSKIFVNNFNNYITSLEKISTFLSNKSNIMKEAAKKHSQIDNSLLEEIKRSDIDE